ncbi:Cwf15/Cwc15 cell cycle control protein [Penicillium digitatum]|uniref:Uncharacterized protein n=3 Tax=Penicillium digitatum TaxID=36651 RepID=K9FVW2_PEND2|nr:hypothetical protein PDIP_41460 [Penicillium digitatum Pd1]EKV12687.1 hypothetical protein PDIG_42880 [Penicillium digitatum PHI26]EKV15087.1 hypothetical protein PDIP_41460 [Penicillium digitatum Pd1]QQK46472.1 Cwf15/Cwc15 cell cycle control protein [Penicillium digitatum]
MGQDSVFVLHSNYVEGVDDEVWVNIGSQFSEDPDNEDADWITVIIPEEMEHTHSDEDILRYALHRIRTRRAIIGEVALHNRGVSCISIPVPLSTSNMADILTRAEADGNKWLEHICNGMVSLDRDVVFGRR